MPSGRRSRRSLKLSHHPARGNAQCSPHDKLLEKRSVEDLITSVGSGGGGAVAVSGGASAATGPAVPAVEAVEEKKEEPKEASDDDMGFSLFD